MGGGDKTSSDYGILWNCESALSSLMLLATEAEGLASKQPEAKAIDFAGEAVKFQSFVEACKSGLGITSSDSVNVQRAKEFLQQLK